jgi:hypothetical protein
MAIDTPSAFDSAPALGLTARSGVALRVRGGLAVWLCSTDAASAPDERAEIVAEDAGGCVVGRVAYRRVYGLRAVLTLTVEETFWQCGLPQALIVSIGPMAVTGGISRFLMRIPASDERLLRMLVDDFGARCRLDGCDADVELDASR